MSNKIKLIFFKILLVCFILNLANGISDSVESTGEDSIDGSVMGSSQDKNEQDKPESGDRFSENNQSEESDEGDYQPTTAADDYLDYISNGGEFSDQNVPQETENYGQEEMDNNGYEYHDQDHAHEHPYIENGLTMRSLLYNHFQKFNNKTELEKKLILAEMMPELDTDQDGALSLEELKSWVEQTSITEMARIDPEEFGWSQIDTDNDDSVSKEEAYNDFLRQMDEVGEREKTFEKLRFKHADKDMDESLSKQEYIRYIMPDSFLDMKDFTVEHYTTEYDTDKDLKISKYEFVMGAGTTEEEMMRYEEERFDALDKDANGYLEKSEIQDAALEHSTVATVNQEIQTIFRTMDEDSDLSVSKEEFMKHYQLLTTDENKQEHTGQQYAQDRYQDDGPHMEEGDLRHEEL